jgi:hypothetical protein
MPGNPIFYAVISAEDDLRYRDGAAAIGIREEIRDMVAV